MHCHLLLTAQCADRFGKVQCELLCLHVPCRLETTAHTISFLLFELAHHPKAQVSCALGDRGSICLVPTSPPQKSCQHGKLWPLMTQSCQGLKGFQCVT